MRHVEGASYLLCWETSNSAPAVVKMSNTDLGKEEEEEKEWEEESKW